MSTDKYWQQRDINELRNECQKDINDDKPPPRCIKQGQINIKHFIYHNQKLRNQLKSTTRKLNGRDLQIEQLRKRIDNLNKQLLNDKTKINELTSTNSQFNQNITNLERKNKNLINQLHLSKQEIINLKNETQQLINKYDDEIHDLKTIIQSLEPNEISDSEEESEELSNESDNDREMTEPRSSPSLSNTQDRNFIVNDTDEDSDPGSMYQTEDEGSANDDDSQFSSS